MYILVIWYILCFIKRFPGGSDSKKSSCNAGDTVWSLGWEDPLEEEITTHLSILAWRIPWTEEPGRLYSPWGYKESDMTEQLRTQSSTERIIWHADHSVSSLILLKFIRRKLQQKQSPQRHIPKNTMISASTAKH